MYQIQCGKCGKSHEDTTEIIIQDDGKKTMRVSCPHCGNVYERNNLVSDVDLFGQPIIDEPTTVKARILKRTPVNYKSVVCTECGINFEAARVDNFERTFCSDVCRAACNRRELKEKQLAVGKKIISSLMGGVDVSILGEKAIRAALRHNGYKWANKEDTYKNSDGVLWQYKNDLFSQNNDDPEPQGNIITARFRKSTPEAKYNALKKRIELCYKYIEELEANGDRESEIENEKRTLRDYEAEARTLEAEIDNSGA